MVGLLKGDDKFAKRDKFTSIDWRVWCAKHVIRNKNLFGLSSSLNGMIPPNHVGYKPFTLEQKIFYSLELDIP